MRRRRVVMLLRLLVVVLSYDRGSCWDLGRHTIVKLCLWVRMVNLRRKIGRSAHWRSSIVLLGLQVTFLVSVCNGVTLTLVLTKVIPGCACVWFDR